MSTLIAITYDTADKANTVHNAVVYTYVFHLEGTELGNISRLYRLKINLIH